jgi:hypothetical protein
MNFRPLQQQRYDRDRDQSPIGEQIRQGESVAHAAPSGENRFGHHA